MKFCLLENVGSKSHFSYGHENETQFIYRPNLPTRVICNLVFSFKVKNIRPIRCTVLDEMGSFTEAQKASSLSPCVKFRKYFEMRQLSENTFQSFNMEVYERFFFS